MKGAIVGDIVGSAFIAENRTSTDFQLFKPVSSFTDDTVLIFSTADSIIHKKDFEGSLKKWVNKYPSAGYKKTFKNWVNSDEIQTYYSNGDGAARRVSPIGLAAETLEEAMELAEQTTKLTHNKPVKIDAAKATVAAIYMAKNGKNKVDIKDYITTTFGYDLEKTLPQLHEEVVTPNLSTPVPAAINVFLLSDNYEDAIRKAISIGGPSNTIGSITGAIAHAYYKHIPKSIIRRALNRLTPEMTIFIEEFEEKYLPVTDVQHEVLISIH
jgi:ADP-ribosylglycohydrolase